MTETFGIDHVASGFPVSKLVSGYCQSVDFDHQHTGIVLLADSPCCFSLATNIKRLFVPHQGEQHIKLVTLSDRSALVFANLPLGGSFFDIGVRFLGYVHIITRYGLTLSQNWTASDEKETKRVAFWWTTQEGEKKPPRRMNRA